MDNYLQWNLVNWITVTLMAVIGVAVFGAAASIVRQKATGDAT